MIARSVAARSALAALLLLSLAGSTAIAAEEPHPVSLRIKDHRFEPAEIRVPAKRRLVIKVMNEDATSEEFESRSLKVEKVIAGKSEATVRVGALEPGRYEFIGEYHEATAKGVIIAE